MTSNQQQQDRQWLPKSLASQKPPSLPRKEVVEKAAAAAAVLNNQDSEVETQESRRLCEHVSLTTGGTCFLAFSRGKDSIAAWLYLRRFFARIIPFHICVVPGLSFVDQSLSYYEQWFGTQILRLQCGATTGEILSLVYQEPGAETYVDACDLWHYERPHIVEVLRSHFNLPNAFVAYGISGGDSIIRKMYIGERHYSSERKTFYPCFDWSPTMIIRLISSQGLKLPKDYFLSDRSFATIRNLRALYRMLNLYPGDFSKIETVFPLIRACFARNEFRQHSHKCETKTTKLYKCG